MGTLYQVCVERGRKVHLGEMSVFGLLGGQHICDKVIPIEEPPRAKDVLNIEYRKLVVRVNN
jgi:hypothetical protein